MKRKFLLSPLVIVVLIVLFGIGAAGAAIYFGTSSGGETNTVGINLQKGLVGWWKFDGNMKDSSSNVLHGTIGGGSPTLTTDRKGELNRAYNFNAAASDSIYLGNPIQLQITGSQTISMWVKPADFAARRNPYAKAYGGEGTITQELDGTLSYYYGTGGGNTSPYQGFSSNTALVAGQWSMITIVRDLSAMTLTWYINGSQKNQNGASYAAAVASGLNAYIGTGYTTNYNGPIDDVRIYNRALNPPEVTALYDSYNPGVMVSDLQKGLVGYWKMNGNSKDSSSGANHGTVGGTTIFTTDRKGTANKAYSFDGSTSYIDIGNATNYVTPNSSTDVTVSTWVNLSVVNSTRRRAVNLDKAAGATALSLHIDSTDNTLGFGYLNTSNTWTPLSSGIVPVVGTWYHLVGVKGGESGGTVKVYVNGVLKNTATDARQYVLLTGEGTSSYLGTYKTGPVDQDWSGSIDDARIYNRALSPTEVTALYDEYDPGIVMSDLQKGLVGWWKMDGNAKDATANSNHGTVTGATLTTDRKGQMNKAYSFNGSSINAGSAIGSTLASFDNDFTISLWLSSNNYVIAAGIFTKTDGGSYWTTKGLSITNISNPQNVYIDINGSSQVTYNTSLGTYGWTHLALVRSGNSVLVYKNGAYQTSLNLTGLGSIVGSQNLFFGVGNGAFWFGNLDDVRVYNRALSQTEITALYQSY